MRGEAGRLGGGSRPRTGLARPGPLLCVPLTCSPHGVTFLAFGNGAPDIFSALVAFSDPRTAGLAFGALFGKSGPGAAGVGGGGGGSRGGAGRAELTFSPPGAGVLVTTVVAGGIAILRPFTAASRPFLRDIVFYMVAVFLTFTALYLGRVTLAWALGEPLQGWAGGRRWGTRAGTSRTQFRVRETLLKLA